MKKFITLCVILIACALIAVPAFAEVQNVKVSGDIDTKAINRSNYDLSNGNHLNAEFTSNYKDSDGWFMTTASLQVDADLTDNVATCVRLLNERDWTKEPNNNNTSNIDVGNTDIALSTAYVTLKEVFYAPLTLKIGRQALRFGNGLVVGDPDTNDATTSQMRAAGQISTADSNALANAHGLTAVDLSARKSFDAIKASFDYNPLTIDLVYAKIDAGTNIGRGSTTVGGVAIGPNQDDVDLKGANLGYKFGTMNSEAEAYVFSKIDRSYRPSNKPEDITNAYGIRGSIEPIAKLILDGELAMQDGHYADLITGRKLDREAWALDIGGSYALDLMWSPKVGARYSYRSGQKAPTADANIDVDSKSTKYEAWSTMFEDQTHGIIANQIFDGDNDGVDSNSHIINLNASVVPIQDLTLAVDYYNYTLAEKFYSTNAEGSVVDTRYMNGNLPYEMKGKTDLGNEVDLSLVYDYTEDVKLGLTAGMFLPGEAFNKTNNNNATTVMADVSVAF